MAYLHCHACGWSQDDFWEADGYNPLSMLKDNIKDLFRDKIEFDSNYKDFGLPKQTMTGPEYVAWELERKAGNIREMVYRTFEEYKTKNPERVCPKCGKKELDID